MAVVTVAPVIETPLTLLTPVAPVAVRLKLPLTVLIPAETLTFWAIRLMSLMPLAESGAETVMLFELVVRLRSAPETNFVALATVMVPEVMLEKLTVRSSTKLPGELPK